MGMLGHGETGSLVFKHQHFKKLPFYCHVCVIIIEKGSKTGKAKETSNHNIQ